MFLIEVYLAKLGKLLQDMFGKRLLYLGLQGSYGRNEQTENSDIDIMAVFDRITVEDLDAYKQALIAAGNYEKSCGFVCGREELACWNPLEICHLRHTTRDIYGDLSALLPAYTLEDERNFIKLSLGNLYHELGHRYLHADAAVNREQLVGSYKSVFYILQNLVFLKKGDFSPSKSALLCHLSGRDKEVLQTSLLLSEGRDFDFDSAFRLLFSWCQEKLTERQADF